jgi:hypothetical protein
MKLRTLIIAAVTTVAIAAPAANAATARALHQQPAKHKTAQKRSTGTTVPVIYFNPPSTNSVTADTQPQTAEATDTGGYDQVCSW